MQGVMLATQYFVEKVSSQNVQIMHVIYIAGRGAVESHRQANSRFETHYRQHSPHSLYRLSNLSS